MINFNLLHHKQYLRKVYYRASPFPHIVIDNFLLPEILNASLEEIKNIDNDRWAFDTGDSHQINKYYLPAGGPDERIADDLKYVENNAPITFDVLNYLYSNEMLNFISNLTGIPNLQADRSWFGAGIHKIVRDGRLDIHADFNLNWKINKYRRANLLLYLNKNWLEEYNGHLELWSRDMSACVKKVTPIFNRAVIFNTDKTSYHGHTIPLAVPEGTVRYSLALYYYSDVPPPEDEEMRFVTWQNAF
jgi:Rps23 Pro-64 3,4-dihydroxylase Tpa1-like proline 4-hydroxylase